MSIFVPEPTSERGRGDAKRHRDKEKEGKKEAYRKYIAENPVITDRNGKAKVPIRRLIIPDFRPGRGDGGGAGVGQGDGDEGDELGRRPGKGKPGQPGQEPGEDYIDSEVDIAEIFESAFEDLGLPKLEEKQVKQLIVELGWKIRGTSKSGPWALLNTKRTVQEGIKRFWFLLEALKEEMKLDELICFSALKKAEGIFLEALLLLQDPNSLPVEVEVASFPIFHTDDFRFHDIKPDIQYQSQAVVIAMMDVSGSMSEDKKFLARTMLAWLMLFLEWIYEKVEIRFITHHTEAKIVEEKVFFSTKESGGTNCYSAYELAGSLIDTEYPSAQWNIYPWHFSDGEDFDTQRTVEELKKLFAKGINMFGYGEIRIGERWHLFPSVSDSQLFTAFNKAFVVEKAEEEGVRVITGKNEPLLGVVITKKEHIYPAIKQFLKKGRLSTHA